MASDEAKNCQTVSAKVPSAVLAELDRIALYRGVSRSYLIRELIDAAVAGEVTLGIPKRSRFRSVGDLAASDVARAAASQAQIDAAAACRSGVGARGGDAVTQDVDATARREAARVALVERP